MNGDPTIWLVARASGVMAYVILTATILAGLVLRARPFGRRLRGATAMEIHRTLSLAALTAIGVHGAALLLDRTVDIGLGALLVPGMSPYRPLWTALGVVAAELVVVVSASFALRARIGIAAWRKLHYATYLIFWLSTLHGLGAGTDSGQPWARGMYVAALGTVAAATTWRVIAGMATPQRSSGRGRPILPPAETK